MSEIFDEYTLVPKTNRILDSIYQAKIEESIKDKKRLEAQVKELKQLRTLMVDHGFENPYAGFKEIYTALRSLNKKDPDYAEEVKNISTGLKILKRQANAKRAVLERIRVAIQAHEMALGRLNAKDKILTAEMNKAMPLGGEYAVKLENINAQGREIFFEIIDKLGTSSEHTHAIVTFEVKAGENTFEESIKLPLGENIKQKLESEYGKDINITEIKFVGESGGLIRDQFSRIAIASTYIEYVKDFVMEKSKGELSYAIDLDRLDKYERIVRKYDLYTDDDEKNLKAYHKLLEELSKNGFMENGQVKQEILDDEFLKNRVYLKNWRVAAEGMLARDLFIYIAKYGPSERKKLKIIPGLRQNIKKEYLDILQILESKDNKDILSKLNIPIIKNARDILFDKIIKERINSAQAKSNLIEQLQAQDIDISLLGLEVKPTKAQMFLHALKE